MRNKYVKRAKLSQIQVRDIVRLFVADHPAIQIAQSCSVSRPTVNRVIHGIRVRLAAHARHASPFAPKDRTRWWRRQDYSWRYGQGLSEPTLSVAIRQYHGKTFTHLIQNYYHDSETLAVQLARDGYQALLCMSSYEAKMLHQTPQHGLLNHSTLSNFISFLRVRLKQRRGIGGEALYLRIKESEMRSNYHYDDLYLLILELLRDQPLGTERA